MTIRITNDGAERVVVRILRQDVPAGEPHALQNEATLRPAESAELALPMDGALVVTRDLPHDE